MFHRDKLAVFVDGDYWHGWRFARWAENLSEYWRLKIAVNRKRDRANGQRLRRLGWEVIRVWEHQLKSDSEACVHRVGEALRKAALRAKKAT